MIIDWLIAFSVECKNGHLESVQKKGKIEILQHTDQKTNKQTKKRVTEKSHGIKLIK